MTPTFTVLIGSSGRSTLVDSLDSIARQQRRYGDQVIVAFDAFERDDAWLTAQVALVESYGPSFEASIYDAGYHWYGIEQINHAMRTVGMTGSHVLTIGDDDVYTDHAFAMLRARCETQPLTPVLFRFVAPWRELLWEVPQMRISRISGCCIAAPRDYVDAFPTQQYIEHDFDWMQGILSRAPQEPDWFDRVLVIARPEARGNDVTHRGILQCWHCKNWRYLEDVALLSEPKCPICHVVVDWPYRPSTARVGA